jgi:hypothetical protein
MRTVKIDNHLVFNFTHRDRERSAGEACRLFLAEMRQTIPAQFRLFDSALNKWKIRLEYAGAIYELRRKYFADAR